MTNKEAIEILKDLWRWEHPNWLEKDIRKALDKGIEALENQKTGHWILADEQNEADVKNDNYQYICSVCGHGDIQSKSVKVPYCWYCGAKMEGENNE